MKTTLRILIVILCILALYYLVVLLTRGVEQEDETSDEIGRTAVRWELVG